jgi:hypothetical protein
LYLQVDNEFVDNSRSEGLILDLNRMTNSAAGRKLSTSVVGPLYHTPPIIKIRSSLFVTLSPLLPLFLLGL